MRPNLNSLPELPSEDHPFFLLPFKTVELSLPQDLPMAFCLNYREIGQGPPLVLFHGLLTSSYTFRHLLEPLGSSWRVILPELIDSTGQQLLPGLDYRPERLAALMLELLQEMKLKRPLLVAQAETGLAAMLLALEHPEVLSGLILIGSALQLSAWTRLRGWLHGFDFVNERWARKMFHHPQKAALRALAYADTTVLSKQEIRQLSQGWSTLPGARARAKILAQTWTNSYREGLMQRLAQLQNQGKPFPVRLVLVYGDSDRQAPRHQGEVLNRIFSGSELLVADHCCGAAHVEKSAWMAQIIASFANPPSVAK